MKGLTMKFPKKTVVIGAVMAIGLLATAGGCDTNADTVRKNTSTEADSFNVQRKIVGINTRTDKYLFYVEGRCSINRENGWLVSICKYGENDYRTNFLSTYADTSVAVTQEAPINVSEYHNKIVLKPEGIIPQVELNLSTSGK